MPPTDYSGRTLDTADFRGHVFDGPADFSDCVFTTRPDFSEAHFQGRAYFARAVFEDGADFYEATFDRFANFGGVRSSGRLAFNGTTFTEGLFSESVEIDGDLLLHRAMLGKTSRVGPLSATAVVVRRAEFQQRVRLDVEAREIRCEHTRFPGGARLLIGGAARVDLTDTEFGGASMVAAQDPEVRPNIVSLTGTDVSSLTLSYVRLDRCRLTGVHNLDQLRIEGHRTFGSTPLRTGLARRFVVWDEHVLRATWGPRLGRGHWRLPEGSDHEPLPETASEVEQVYRALRRGANETKDEMAAADFYFGEMEMRRFGQYCLAQSRRRDRMWLGWLGTRGDHLLLWLYWAVSGYGLRAWRAFAVLACVVVLTATAFLAWGYPPKTDMSYADSVRYTLRAATSILRAPEQKLTPTGEWIELALRFTGPILLGLALLALRSRLKR